MTAAALQATEFSALPGWAEADHAAALGAFRRSARAMSEKPPRSGTLGIGADRLAALAEPAQRTLPRDARNFFEDNFTPARIDPGEGRGQGFLTGYYEPVVEASAVRTDRFTVPLHRRPPDLVRVDPGAASGLPDPTLGFARRELSGTLSEYFDRAEIARGALDGRGLEIAWLADPVDAFFIHVQGSARLQLQDGRRIRVGYAGKTGHRFTAIGRILVAEGELVLEKADMEGIRRWLAENPSRVRELLDRNRSYIFFHELPELEETLGPVGAAGVPLTPLASLAVDHELHTYGTPVFLDAPSLALGGRAFRQLMIAQDTGSAIVGPARGDVFVGTGEAAGRTAGAVRHSADFYALVPTGGLSR